MLKLLKLNTAILYPFTTVLHSFVVLVAISLTLMPVIAFASSPICRSITLMEDFDLKPFMPSIKAQVGTVWERRQRALNVTQAEAARALGISQSAFSKLLTDKTGHPWTQMHLRRLAVFLQISFKDLLPDELGNQIEDGSNLASPNTSLFEEIVLEISRYYTTKGVPFTREQIIPIAEDTVTLLNNSPRFSLKQMRAAIDQAISMRALRNIP